MNHTYVISLEFFWRKTSIHLISCQNSHNFYCKWQPLLMTIHKKRTFTEHDSRKGHIIQKIIHGTTKNRKMEKNWTHTQCRYKIQYHKLWALKARVTIKSRLKDYTTHRSCLFPGLSTGWLLTFASKTTISATLS